jgi:hypothetical protein
MSEISAIEAGIKPVLIIFSSSALCSYLGFFFSCSSTILSVKIFEEFSI